MGADAVLVCDPDETTLGASAVLIEDGVIAAIGELDGMRATHSDLQVLDGAGCVLLPGWINTHTHLAMNIFRGLTDDVTLEVFLQRSVAAEVDPLTPELVATGVRAALAECLLGGTTGALDMYFFHESAAAHIAHCPASNLKLACGIAPVARMLEEGVDVACGTDGAASAGALDMLQSVRLAALLAKGQTQSPTAIPAYRAIRMATADAARALGWEAVGQIAVGMRADLQLIDLGSAATAPWHDPAARVVYSAGAYDVRHVIVDGAVVVRDRELRTIDVTAALADLQVAADQAAAVVARLAAS